MKFFKHTHYFSNLFSREELNIIRSEVRKNGYFAKEFICDCGYKKIRVIQPVLEVTDIE